jgi:hypothetical protein
MCRLSWNLGTSALRACPRLYRDFLLYDYYVKAHAQKPVFVFGLNVNVYVFRPGATTQSAIDSQTELISLQRAYRCEVLLHTGVDFTDCPLHSPVSPPIPLRRFAVCRREVVVLWTLS